MIDRIQRRRTKDWRMPKDCVYVGRGSVFGNPWRVGDDHPITGRRMSADVVSLFRRWLEGNYDDDLGSIPRREKLFAALPELRLAKSVACWCAVDSSPCHGDVLLNLVHVP